MAAANVDESDYNEDLYYDDADDDNDASKDGGVKGEAEEVPKSSSSWFPSFSALSPRSAKKEMPKNPFVPAKRRRPTAEQQAACDELRALVNVPATGLYRNHDLHRFLTARKYDVQKAADMLRAEMAWRSQLPDLTIKDVEDEPEYQWKVMQWIPGTDKFGRPILYLRTGRLNPKKRRLEAFQKMVPVIMDHCIKNMKPGVSQFVCIFDYTGWGMRNADMDTTKLLADCLQDNYPERLGAIFIAHNPFVFWALYKVVSMWLDERVKEKINFLSGDDMAGQLSVLLDRDQVPDTLGGDWTPEQGVDSFADDEPAGEQ